LLDGVVAPVDGLLQLRHRVHRSDHPGLADELAGVLSAGLDQRDGGTRVGEAAGDDRAGAAGSHYDVVGGLSHVVLLGFEPKRPKLKRVAVYLSAPRKEGAFVAGGNPISI